MWKKLGDMFFSTGEANQNGERAADAMLGQLWISLIRLGTSRGLMLPDAQDLAQESIVAGMQSFDPGRGDFSAFCKKIMANRVKNHHRDKKHHEPIPEDGGNYRDPDDGPGWASYRRQCREKSDRILSDTIAMLDEQETSFFMTLVEVNEELAHGEVSEAARRAGITPQQGWDIFRKIQRRFKDLDRSILIPEPPPDRAYDPSARFSLGGPVSPTASKADFFSPHSPLSDIPPPDVPYLCELHGRYRRFSTDLGPVSRRQLRGLLGQ